MILVTVGAQMPFDRLIAQVDEWAGARGRSDVFAQIGPSEYRAHHIETTPFLNPSEFRERVQGCSAIVGHAGMGTIITALQYSKPLIVLPRLGALGETRNDHQTSTARRFAETGRVLAAFDESELTKHLDAIDDLPAAAKIDEHASPELIARVRAYALGKS